MEKTKLTRKQQELKKREKNPSLRLKNTNQLLYVVQKKLSNMLNRLM